MTITPQVSVNELELASRRAAWKSYVRSGAKHATRSIRQSIIDDINTVGNAGIGENRLGDFESIYTASTQQAAGFLTLQAELIELLRRPVAADPDTEGGCSVYSWTTTMSIISDAYLNISTAFPPGSASSDPPGGVRIEWLHQCRHLTLVVPPIHGGQTYIHHYGAGVRGTDPVVCGSQLAFWLDWLASE